MTLMQRDIVVIGASRGGVAALSLLVSDLPCDLAASLFVVLHIRPDVPGCLAAILSQAGRLPAMYATNLQPIERGWIFVAPPDRHLVLDPGLMRLSAGPKEHHTRPAADPLFCSAAAAYGPRVVGVVLTGGGGDGASGLIAIQQKGGIAIVQDPDDAVDPSMPRHALNTGHPNYSLPLTEIAPFLVRLITGLEDDERSR